MRKVVRLFFTLFTVFAFNATAVLCFATPYYGLSPKEIVLRGEFYTTYSSSTQERKHNIELCAKSLDGAFVSSGSEFSFNAVVGNRTEENGYARSKVIVGGEFTDGVGGGVCQVSSTLYNALLLSGVTVTECHQHTLQVGYVAPSFDAMVNFNYADLKFVNDTKNPMYIKTFTDGNILKISVYGEPNDRKYERKSVVTQTIPCVEEVIIDENCEYPDVKKGERKIISYGRDGIKSEGYLFEYDLDGNLLKIRRIRKNSYAPIKTVVIEGVCEPDDVKTENFIMQEIELNL